MALVLMALDLATTQIQLNIIDINLGKTKLVIFNKRSLKDNREYVTLGYHRIETIESYCYLGIRLHMNGSMTCAMNELRLKALRAMYALRKNRLI